MALKSLLLCSDEKIVRVLRRVLGDLEIEVELCLRAETALRKLTRQRFEAIIADLSDDGASEVLSSARNAPCNKQAVAVAIVEPIVGLKAVFQVGAHFVLYKPVSSERAKSSFRAARALMKSERRRNIRVAVEIPVVMRSSQAGGNIKVTTIDLSEGGMAIALPNRHRPTGRWEIAFSLPGTGRELEIPAEFAWESAKKQGGLRFVQLTEQARQQLQEWLRQNSPEAEQDDPPDSLPAERSQPGRMLSGDIVSLPGLKPSHFIDACRWNRSASTGTGENHASGKRHGRRVYAKHRGAPRCLREVSRSC